MIFGLTGSWAVGAADPQLLALSSASAVATAVAQVSRNRVRTRLSRRGTRPTLECVRKRADFLISEQPRDLRNRQVLVDSNSVQRDWTSDFPRHRKKSVPRTTAAGLKIVGLSRAVGRFRLRAPCRPGGLEQLHSQRLIGMNRASLVGQRAFLQNRDQELVEVRIRANDRHLLNGWRKCDFIDACTKIDTTANELGKFRAVIISPMGKTDTRRHHSVARQLLA